MTGPNQNNGQDGNGDDDDRTRIAPLTPPTPSAPDDDADPWAQFGTPEPADPEPAEPPEQDYVAPEPEPEPEPELRAADPAPSPAPGATTPPQPDPPAPLAPPEPDSAPAPAPDPAPGTAPAATEPPATMPPASQTPPPTADTGPSETTAAPASGEATDTGATRAPDGASVSPADTPAPGPDATAAPAQATTLPTADAEPDPVADIAASTAPPQTTPPAPDATAPPADEAGTGLEQPPGHPAATAAPQANEERTLFAASTTAVAAAAAPLMPGAHPPGSAAQPEAGADAPAYTGPAMPQGASTVHIGTRINNNYEIKEVLKAGGMGEVYRGENVFTGDEVAIKVVLPELAEDEKVGLMFKREARTLSQLGDEAIVRYHNFVHDPEINRYCLIMEFIRGVPLSDLTATQGPITVEAAVKLMDRLAKGLEQAHKREVIHRDLSPDNVMLPDGIVAEAVLIDFGIAKSNVVKEGTMAGQFAGKFKYVAPEQLGHFDGIVGPATDIYGLALLIAAAVIGSPLDMGASIVEAVQKRESIPDLSDVPEALRPLLGHMLEPNPANRPVSMDAVRNLLENPAQIPPQYGRVPGAGGYGASAPGLAAPPVPGLQQPTTAPVTMSPYTQAPTPLEPLEEPKSSKLGLVASLVMLAVLGGGGYVAWDKGLFDGLLAEPVASPDTPATPSEPVAKTLADLPAPLENTREGFLATFQPAPCTFVTRIATGANTGLLQGFATTAGTFSDLPLAYEAKFGASPTVLDRVVTQAQCPAIDFMRSFQGRGANPIALGMQADTLHSGASLAGELVDPDGRPVWLALVSPQGTVYNLTGQLGPRQGDSRSFQFGLRLPPDVEAAGQLIVAIATDEPLAVAATAQARSQAAELFPRVRDELIEKGGAEIAATFLVVTQPPPPPPPEPAPDDTAPPAPAQDGEAAPSPGDDAPPASGN